jgi:hypothetical protein
MNEINANKRIPGVQNKLNACYIGESCMAVARRQCLIGVVHRLAADLSTSTDQFNGFGRCSLSLCYSTRSSAVIHQPAAENPAARSHFESRAGVAAPLALREKLL